MSVTEETIRADVAAMLECRPEDIAADENLIDLGLDSMRIMTLVEKWREAGAADLEFVDLAEQPEIGHWASVLANAA